MVYGTALKAGPLTIDTAKHEVTVEGESVKLTLTEFKLLAALVGARGRGAGGGLVLHVEIGQVGVIGTAVGMIGPTKTSGEDP
jgi:hypothetical protein